MSRVNLVSQEFKESAHKIIENIRRYIDHSKNVSKKFIEIKEIIEADIASRYIILQQELQAQKDAVESGGSVGIEWTEYNVICAIKRLIYDNQTIDLLDPNKNPKFT